MAKSIIVYGRSDWGVAKYAERMRKHFGLKHVVVDFDGKVHKDNGYLYIAYCYLPGSTPSTMRVMSFEEVAKQINDAIPLTGWINCYREGQPVRPGWYEVNYYADEPGYPPHEKRRYYDGEHWCFNADRVGMYFGSKSGNGYHGEAWRGLSEEPILVKP